MINTNKFFNLLIENEVSFFTGVPDSLLQDICACITEHCIPKNHIIAANEGGAIGIASGYHFATGKIPVVYMQNSGIGNSMNPLLSLVDPDVYSIPMLLMIGWRGEPGKSDEPQHIKQGKVTLDLFNSMDIPYEILPDDFVKTKEVIIKSINYIKDNNKPLALIIRKGLFESFKMNLFNNNSFQMSREQAIKIIIDNIHESDVVVSTTGKISRELFEYREALGQGHKNDFLTVGSMGHSSQIALGISLEKPSKQVFCFDGDGAVLMHAGSLGIIGELGPPNFKHIIFNNGSHDSVGGQPTIGLNVNFENIAKGFNYKNYLVADEASGLKDAVIKLRETAGPLLLEVKVSKGARSDLGRPTSSPIENKMEFMRFLGAY